MAECNEVHSHKYTYNNTQYVGGRKKIVVTCPEHGDFTIQARNHRDGQGCRECTKKAISLSFSQYEPDFIEKAKAVHGDTYSYDNLKYINLEHKVNITCKFHGDFLTDGRGHLKGKGCPICAKIRVGATLEHFLERSKEIHGDRYDYSLVQYKNSRLKVEIVCSQHGSFMQTLSCHVAGKGCPDCGTTGYKRSKSGSLYVLTDDKGLTKIGITNKPVRLRVRQLNEGGQTFRALADFWFEDGSKAADLELKFLAEYRVSHEQPSERFAGYTECFYNVDVDKLLANIRLEVP